MKNKQNNGLVKNPLLYILVVIALVTGFQYLMAGNSVNRSQQINYTELVKEIEKGNVKDISYQPNGSVVEISGTYKKSKEVKDTTGIQFFHPLHYRLKNSLASYCRQIQLFLNYKS